MPLASTRHLAILTSVEIATCQHVNLKLLTTPRKKGTNSTQHAKIKLSRPGFFWRSNWAPPGTAPKDRYATMRPRAGALTRIGVPHYLCDGGSSSTREQRRRGGTVTGRQRRRVDSRWMASRSRLQEAEAHICSNYQPGLSDYE